MKPAPAAPARCTPGCPRSTNGSKRVAESRGRYTITHRLRSEVPTLPWRAESAGLGRTASFRSGRHSLAPQVGYFLAAGVSQPAVVAAVGSRPTSGAWDLLARIHAQDVETGLRRRLEETVPRPAPALRAEFRIRPDEITNRSLEHGDSARRRRPRLRMMSTATDVSQRRQYPGRRWWPRGLQRRGRRPCRGRRCSPASATDAHAAQAPSLA